MLVRIKNRRSDDKHNAWLLIKHRDEFARDGNGDDLLAEDRSVASGRSMADIAAGKRRGPKPFILGGMKNAPPDSIWNSNKGRAVDLRAAESVSQAPAPKVARPTEVKSKTKAAPQMPRFIKPELCKLIDRPPSSAGWVHEIKLDGYRIQARVEDGHAVLRTRKGLDWTDKFVAIARAAASLPNGIYDGEVVALDKRGASDFGALQSALAEGSTDELIFFVFDLLFDVAGDLQDLPLGERKARLKDVVKRLGQDSVIRYVEHFDASGESVLENVRKMSLEGVVSKQLGGTYRSGQRAWTKTKCRPGQEVVLGGWTDEAGRFRSLLAGIYRDNHLVYVGRVGTGFSEGVVSRILPQLKKRTVDKNPFDAKNTPRQRAGIHWLKPTLIAEIEFAGWTDDGNIRAAAFKGLRDDKPASEIVADKPAPVQVQAPDLAGKSTTSRASVAPKLKHGGSASVMDVVISHPDKAMWPSADDDKPVTKLDLAHYYEAVGAWMIGYIQGRPCSIVRAPDGIKGQHFFQRHAMPGMSTLLTTMKVSGDHEPYLQINTVEGLIAVAQLAALELHPWNCEPGAPEIAGRLVFDFDPAPDVNFNTVIDAAREMRDRLDRLGLISFCKTTGGKGLHVVTPVSQSKKAPLDWQVTKTFAEAVVNQMAADSPTRYLTTESKKERTGRIFLDYLRNDRTATAVAVLSTRSRAGATVSMPLDWTQVKPGLHPARFTVRTAPALLEKNNAWKDYDDAKRPLEDAIRTLTKSRAT